MAVRDKAKKQSTLQARTCHEQSSTTPGHEQRLRQEQSVMVQGEIMRAMVRGLSQSRGTGESESRPSGLSQD